MVIGALSVLQLRKSAVLGWSSLNFAHNKLRLVLFLSSILRFNGGVFIAFEGMFLAKFLNVGLV